MRHCCQFKPDDTYYLADSEHFSSRLLSIGFCPICNKPVAELTQWRFDGKLFKEKAVGIRANTMMLELKDQIIYSASTLNYKKFKTKPYGWKYGINKSFKCGNQEKIKQYACDFYGNKERIR